MDKPELRWRQMMALRADAQERGLMDLAIVYGWSAIRLGHEVLDQRVQQRSTKDHGHENQ